MRRPQEYVFMHLIQLNLHKLNNPFGFYFE